VGEQYNRDQYNPAHFNGGIQISNEDMIKLRAHIAMMEETSSFELALYNFDKQYIETYPIQNKDFVRIFIGRGTVMPQVFQGKVEEIDAESEAMYHELTLKGRCIGEDLYRRLVTGLFQNKKGEVIVKHLLDNYCSFLHHKRNDVELIEDTDTTYTELESINKPLKDILDKIAATADKAGIIGFDYRVEYDGLFAFFASGSKTSPINLMDVIKYSNYRRTVHRFRNRIYIYGAQEKTDPLDMDSWTESLNDWDSGGYGTLSLSTQKVYGVYSVQVQRANRYVQMKRSNLGTVQCGFGGAEKYRYLNLFFYPHANAAGQSDIVINFYTSKDLPDAPNISWFLPFDSFQMDKWNELKLTLGPKEPCVYSGPARGIWWYNTAPDWDDIQKIEFRMDHEGSTDTYLRVDKLHFSDARWNAIAENITDPNDIREMTETDEELHSDVECLARANAYLDWLKDEAELLTLQTEILDLGNNRVQPGDMQNVVLPNENINKSFRVTSIDYVLDEEQELPITIELGKETLLLADYLYRLRKETSIMARLKSGVAH
jgi:hypothetical protein